MGSNYLSVSAEKKQDCIAKRQSNMASKRKECSILLKIVLRRRIGSKQSRRQSNRLGGAKRLSGGQSLKLSTKASVFKRASLLIGGANHVNWGARPALALALAASAGKCCRQILLAQNIVLVAYHTVTKSLDFLNYILPC